MKVTVKPLITYYVNKRLKWRKCQLALFCLPPGTAHQLRIRWISTDRDVVLQPKEPWAKVSCIFTYLGLRGERRGGLGEEKYCVLSQMEEKCLQGYLHLSHQIRRSWQRHLKKASAKGPPVRRFSHGGLVEASRLGTQIHIRMWLARGILSPWL